MLPRFMTLIFTTLLILVGCVLDAPTTDGGDPLPAGLTIQAEVTGPPPPGVELPLYAPDSLWNTPIPADAALDANSETMIAQLVADARTGSSPPALSVREWSVTAYVADADTPRHDVTLTARWAPFSVLTDVPIPEGALPDPAGDGDMTIIDVAGGYTYDLWQAAQNADGTWQASWGNRIALSSSGIYPHGMSARGSGFASLAGVIWPEEFEAGVIEHALVMSLPNAAHGGPVWPATESDGRSRAAGAIPEGARLQLDPTLDLDAFTLTPYERIIAEALQTYGAYVGDVSGSVELEVVNPISYPADPYPAGWFDQRWTLLEGIPWEHMRVLELPPQTDLDLFVADESIYER